MRSLPHEPPPRGNAPNWQNRTLFIADNLPVLRGMNSESVALIYLDPPFNSDEQYKATIGTKAEGQKFNDTWRWTDLDERWLGEIDRRNEALSAVIHTARLTQNDGTAAYLVMMGIRLLELRRVLKPTGSIYLHCDDTAGHYLKLAMDAVFAAGNYRNDIAWKRHTSVAKGSQHAPKTWGRNMDSILYYAKEAGKAPLRPYRAMTEEERRQQFPLQDEEGRRYYDDSAHIYRTPGMGERPNLCFRWSPPGRPDLVFENPHKSGWRLSKPRLNEEWRLGNIKVKPNGKLQRRKYEEAFKGKQVGNLWDDINPAAGKESTGWKTQKPLALLQRIIKASSNPGEVVLDPFAGCATCCVAAEIEGRQWVGIEACEAGSEIVQVRLHDHVWFAGVGEQRVTITRSAPMRTDADGKAEVTRKRTVAYRTEQNMDALYGRQRGVCKGCGNHYRHKDFHFDHVVAQKKGGSDELDNLQLLCGHCNSTKGTGTMEDLRRRLAAQRNQH